VRLEDVERARDLVSETSGSLSARDGLHVAVMQRERIRRVLSFDRGFDGVEGIERLAD
jgi:hypothetical protein